MPKRKSKKSLSKVFLDPQKIILLVFFLGFILVFSGIALRIHETNRLSFSAPIPEAISIPSAKPVQIMISALDINLRIGQTTTEKAKWEVYKDGASHLSTSANPFTSGNIIIYGHNTKNRFKKLPEIKNGDIIILKTSDGKERKYKVVEIQTVKPDQTSLLLPTTVETLTVYTCAGFADTERFVVRSTPVLE
jgi:LPXTG-site transpeptidase (sortase) family protein